MAARLVRSAETVAPPAVATDVAAIPRSARSPRTPVAHSSTAAVSRRRSAPGNRAGRRRAADAWWLRPLGHRQSRAGEPQVCRGRVIDSLRRTTRSPVPSRQRHSGRRALARLGVHGVWQRSWRPCGYGCLLRTTAEVLVAVLPEWELTREHDPVSGYRELKIARRSPLTRPP